MNDDLLWPTYGGPADLAAVEAVPLAARGLPASTYAIVTRAAQRWPDRPALSVLPDATHFDDPVRLTFAELAAAVHRTANALTALGVRRHQPVGIVCPNTADVLVATLAAQAVGIAAPVNPALAPERIAALLRAAGSRVVVVAGPELDPRTWETVAALAPELGVRALLVVRPTGAGAAAPPLPPVPGVLVAHLADAVAGHAADRLVDADPPTADEVAAYFHTGGTTGAPKIAVHTQANEVVMAWSLAASTGLGEDESLFAALPLFHVNALHVTGLAPLLRGQHVVWAGPAGYRDPALYAVFWRLVERYRVAAMSAVPTVYAVLAQVPVDADISSLRLPAVGAAPLPRAVRAGFLARTGVDLVEGYGMTEATCASARSFPGAQRPGAVGQRLPYQQITAVDVDPDTGTWTDLPPGDVGLLVVSGPTVFAGYLGADRRPDPGTAVRDGRLDTGDRGSVDADGFVHLAGRVKDLIIRGGHNIDPSSIEESLLAHPAVSAAAAVGRPDMHSGEVPVGYVTLYAGSDTTPATLREWASMRAAEPAAAPKDVHVIEVMPLTAVGKVYAPALRADAVRRVVLDELAGAGDVLVDEATLRATVTVTDPAERDRVAGALDRYPIDWAWAGSLR